MSTIRVGQANPRTYDVGNVTVAVANEQTVVTEEQLEKKYSDEERQAVIREIMNLPKAQIVPKLREKGFNDVADFVEQQMREQEEKAEEMRREVRLKEILAMDEDEQLPLLLEEGYDEEAKKLSEKLAAQQEESSSDEAQGDCDGSQHANDEPDSESDAEAFVKEEPEKEEAKTAPKKGGRRKKDA